MALNEDRSPSAYAAGQEGKDRQRERDADQADRKDLVVEPEVERRDRADPESSRDAREVGDGQRVDGHREHARDHQAQELAKGRGADDEGRADPERRPRSPDRPDRQVRRRAAHRAPGRCHDPEASGEQDRADDDPRRVEDRRERIEQEPPVRDEDLAKRDRRREHHLRETVDAQELDVQILGRRIEPFGDDARQPRCGDEDADAGDRHQADRAGQHRAPEVVRRFVAVVVAEPAVDRHERERSARPRPGRRGRSPGCGTRRCRHRARRPRRTYWQRPGSG